ncbi:hypothetical protein KIN20_004546 [Parelaphostrongylus tenuis]|uniref:Uncharacterized protein n=1 Tax=Parelaphostrongylus tenuis TaxID=148309 RepID=A0AAD5MJY7_PARTN|nr:hypothetical protein KIN20_004546 [Parelaphostrongylus tenuis]
MNLGLCQVPEARLPEPPESSHPSYSYPGVLHERAALCHALSTSHDDGQLARPPSRQPPHVQPATRRPHPLVDATVVVLVGCCQIRIVLLVVVVVVVTVVVTVDIIVSTLAGFRQYFVIP